MKFQLHECAKKAKNGTNYACKVGVMRYTSHIDRLEKLTACYHKSFVTDYIWSTSEKGRLRATALYLIQSIVERHGGSVEVDLATNTININVPKGEQGACAQEIEEQVGAIPINPKCVVKSP